MCAALGTELIKKVTWIMLYFSSWLVQNRKKKKNRESVKCSEKIAI